MRYLPQRGSSNLSRHESLELDISRPVSEYPNILFTRPSSSFFPLIPQARMRRAQAYEACERYKSALQDVRHVLAYGQDKVGKLSYDLANGMQHRLNRVIAQLKA